MLFAAAFLTSAMAMRAATFQVGPTRVRQTVGSLPALGPGDVVEIDPATYPEVKRWTTSGTAANPITIRGIGGSRPVFDATGLNVDGSLPHPRAVFQVEGNYITLENLEFMNATNGGNGAGIRVTSGKNVTVRNCRITACDMGIMSDHNDNLLIEASEIAANGTALYDGYSHNFYLGGTNTTVRFCYIHDSLYGQNFKTRGHYTELLYNYIADSQDGEIGLVDAAETAAANSHAVMLGNIVISKPRLGAYNHVRFIQFGQDSGGAHNGALFAFNNTFVAGDGRIQFLSANATGSTILAGNNIFFGSGQIIGTTGGGIIGSNNWMQSTATLPAGFWGTVRGSVPGFVDTASRIFRLKSSSGCRYLGLSGLLFLDGQGSSHSGLPVSEYVNHQQSRPRPIDAVMDFGAYEYAPPLILNINRTGTVSRVTVKAIPGVFYDLLQVNDLAAANWNPVVTNVPGFDGPIELAHTNAAAQGFYRVRTSL